MKQFIALSHADNVDAITDFPCFFLPNPSLYLNKSTKNMEDFNNQIPIAIKSK